MRYFGILFSLIIIAVSCHKENCESTLSCEKYYLSLGDWELLPSSLDTIPFNGRSGAIYRDSLGNEVEMEIIEFPISGYLPVHGTLYDVHSQGDILECDYRQNVKAFHLYFSELNIKYFIRIAVIVEPLGYTDFRVFDSYHIMRGSLEVFYDILNPRKSITSYPKNINVGPIDIFGKVFENALVNEPIWPHKELFNYIDGLISFQDSSGKVWRFDHFIN